MLWFTVELELELMLTEDVLAIFCVELELLEGLELELDWLLCEELGELKELLDCELELKELTELSELELELKSSHGSYSKLIIELELLLELKSLTEL